MSATQRLAVFLVVSLLTHGLILKVMPAPGHSFRAPAFLRVVLSAPAPHPAPRPFSPSAMTAAPPAPILPVAETPVADLQVSPPEPVADTTPAPVAAPDAGQSTWRSRPWGDPAMNAGIALAQEAERRRQEMQARTQMTGNLWMGMFQRLSGTRVQAEGSCTLRRETAFRLDCDNDAVFALVESLNISTWANKLGALDPALVELRVVASDGSVRLQAVTPVVAPTEAPR